MANMQQNSSNMKNELFLSNLNIKKEANAGGFSKNFSIPQKGPNSFYERRLSRKTLRIPESMTEVKRPPTNAANL